MNDLKVVNDLKYRSIQGVELKNDINQYYTDQKHLLVFCNGKKKLQINADGDYDIINNKIKIINSLDDVFSNNIFIVIDVNDDWSDTDQYMLKIEPYYPKNTELKNKMEYAEKSETFWIPDDSEKIYADELSNTSKKISDMNKNESNIVKYNNEFEYYKNNVKRERKQFYDNQGKILFFINEVDINNLLYDWDVLIAEGENIYNEGKALLTYIYKLKVEWYDILIFLKKHKIFDIVNFDLSKNKLNNDLNTFFEKKFAYEKQVDDYKQNILKNITKRKEYMESIVKLDNQEEEENLNINIINLEKDTKQSLFKFPLENGVGEKIKVIAFPRYLIRISASITDVIEEKTHIVNYITGEKEIDDVDKYLKGLPMFERGGVGGLYYGLYRNNKEWDYFWKEWDIEFKVFCKPMENYNVIKSFSNISTKSQIVLLFECEGASFLEKKEDTYDIIGKKIKIYNYNNVYTSDTIFILKELVINGAGDTYSINIEPVENSLFLDKIINYKNDGYWELFEEEGDKDIVGDTEVIQNSHENCETLIIKKEEKKSEPASIIISQKTVHLKLPKKNIDGETVTYPIIWAVTINNSVILNPSLPHPFSLYVENGDEDYTIRFYSQIPSINKIKGNSNNYYKNEIFRDIPNVKLDESTYGIYTSGATDGVKSNLVPKKDMWFQSKILPINIKIVHFSPPEIYKYKIHSDNGRVDIFWRSKYFARYDIYRLNAKKSMRWEKIKENTTDMQYNDYDVEKFITYKYKIISYTDNYKEEYNRRIYSLPSKVISIFICNNNRFPGGRYNSSSIQGCKKNNTNQKSIYSSANSLTKKQIFSLMAKKGGGGTYR